MKTRQLDNGLAAVRKSHSLIVWLGRFGLLLLGAYLAGIIPGLACAPVGFLIVATSGIPAAQGSFPAVMVGSEFLLGCGALFAAWVFFRKIPSVAAWGFLGFGAMAIGLGIISLLILAAE